MPAEPAGSCPETATRSSRRDRIAAVLRSRPALVVELLLAATCLALKFLHVIRNPSLLLFLVGWIFLWLRRSGWRALGLTRPAKPALTIVLAIALAAVYQTIDVRWLLPMIERWTATPIDLSAYTSLRGNASLLAAGLLLSWVTAAFPEELAWRGYLFDRIDLALGRGRAGAAVALVLTSVAFGLAHLSQGRAGVIDNVVAGAFFATLYLASGRNLWLPILTHGAIDTIGCVLLYLGVRPR